MILVTQAILLIKAPERRFSNITSVEVTNMKRKAKYRSFILKRAAWERCMLFLYVNSESDVLAVQ